MALGARGLRRALVFCFSVWGAVAWVLIANSPRFRLTRRRITDDGARQCTIHGDCWCGKWYKSKTGVPRSEGIDEMHSKSATAILSVPAFMGCDTISLYAFLFAIRIPRSGGSHVAHPAVRRRKEGACPCSSR